MAEKMRPSETRVMLMMRLDCSHASTKIRVMTPALWQILGSFLHRYLRWKGTKLNTLRSSSEITPWCASMNQLISCFILATRPSLSLLRQTRSQASTIYLALVQRALNQLSALVSLRLAMSRKELFNSLKVLHSQVRQNSFSSRTMTSGSRSKMDIFLYCLTSPQLTFSSSSSTPSLLSRLYFHSSWATSLLSSPALSTSLRTFLVASPPSSSKILLSAWVFIDQAHSISLYPMTAYLMWATCFSEKSVFSQMLITSLRESVGAGSLVLPWPSPRSSPPSLKACDKSLLAMTSLGSLQQWMLSASREQLLLQFLLMKVSEGRLIHFLDGLCLAYISGTNLRQSFSILDQNSWLSSRHRIESQRPTSL